MNLSARLAAAAFLPLLLAGAAGAAAPTAAGSLHGCFSKPDGETFLALSLEAKSDAPADQEIDLVVLFDTSASQTAIYRDKALAALEELLATLNPLDRVKLIAVDVQAVEMTTGFTKPQSDAMKLAVSKLKHRTPLGATDMVLSMDTAAKAFDAESHNGRAVIYIGDGMSAANILSPKELHKLINGLVALRAPVSSYSIGPRIDNELLGAIANNTGGNLVMDGPDKPAKAYARDLANSAHGQVFYPLQSQFPDAMVEILPKQIPPLRSDRDTILIGRGKLEGTFPVKMTVEWQGRKYPLTWTVTANKPTDDNAFLVDLVTRARGHAGVGLPTAGRGGLVEVRRLLDDNVRKLITLARTALATQSVEQAEQLAKKALEIDPTNPEARAVIAAAAKLKAEGKVPNPKSKLKLKAKEPEKK